MDLYVVILDNPDNAKIFLEDKKTPVSFFGAQKMYARKNQILKPGRLF